MLCRVISKKSNGWSCQVGYTNHRLHCMKTHSSQICTILGWRYHKYNKPKCPPSKTLSSFHDTSLHCLHCVADAVIVPQTLLLLPPDTRLYLGPIALRWTIASMYVMKTHITKGDMQASDLRVSVSVSHVQPMMNLFEMIFFDLYSSIAVDSRAACKYTCKLGGKVHCELSS